MPLHTGVFSATEIDCSSAWMAPICCRFGIDTYPSVLIFPNGTTEYWEFLGDRDYFQVILLLVCLVKAYTLIQNVNVTKSLFGYGYRCAVHGRERRNSLNPYGVPRGVYVMNRTCHFCERKGLFSHIITWQKRLCFLQMRHALLYDRAQKPLKSLPPDFWGHAKCSMNAIYNQVMLYVFFVPGGLACASYDLISRY